MGILSLIVSAVSSNRLYILYPRFYIDRTSEYYDTGCFSDCLRVLMFSSKDDGGGHQRKPKYLVLLAAERNSSGRLLDWD